VIAAALLEGLQAFTLDRTANLEAALYGTGGVVVAALTAEFFIRAWRRHDNGPASRSATTILLISAHTTRWACNSASDLLR
jgi:hypothetical protein